MKLFSLYLVCDKTNFGYSIIIKSISFTAGKFLNKLSVNQLNCDKRFPDDYGFTRDEGQNSIQKTQKGRKLQIYNLQENLLRVL